MTVGASSASWYVGGEDSKRWVSTW
jgi:hypothetical protein